MFCVDIFTYFHTFPKKATSRQRACFSILIFLLMFLLQQRLPSRKLDFVVSFWFRCLETSAHCAFLFVLINLKWVDRKWQMSKRSCFSFQSTTWHLTLFVNFSIQFKLVSLWTLLLYKTGSLTNSNTNGNFLALDRDFGGVHRGGEDTQQRRSFPYNLENPLWQY